MEYQGLRKNVNGIKCNERTQNDKTIPITFSNGYRRRKYKSFIDQNQQKRESLLLKAKDKKGFEVTKCSLSFKMQEVKD